MNKNIKIIELLEMFYKKEKMPQKIRVSCYDFEYDEEVNAYFNLDKNSNNNSLIQDWLNNASKLNNEVEILEDNTEEIEELNAYKLMESPYMADLLKEQRYDTFMELLKQSEVEIADKLIKLTWAVKEIRKDLNK